MSEIIKLSAEEFSDLADDLEPVAKDNWRHGHRDTFVFEKDGKHWRTVINVHHEEGWQLDDEVICTRVYPHQVTAIEWRPTPSESTRGARQASDTDERRSAAMSDDVVICSRCFARAARTDSYAPTCFQGVEHDWQPGGVPRPPEGPVACTCPDIRGTGASGSWDPECPAHGTERRPAEALPTCPPCVDPPACQTHGKCMWRAPASVTVGRQEGMTVAAAKRALPCDPHGLTPKKHCREMERMLREVGDPFLSGEGDSPHEAVRRLREAYDEAREELVSASASPPEPYCDVCGESGEGLTGAVEVCRTCLQAEQYANERLREELTALRTAVPHAAAMRVVEAARAWRDVEEGKDQDETRALMAAVDAYEASDRNEQEKSDGEVSASRGGDVHDPRGGASRPGSSSGGDAASDQDVVSGGLQRESGGAVEGDGASRVAADSSSLDDEERAFTWLTQRSSLVTVVSLAALLADVRRETIEELKREGKLR